MNYEDEARDLVKTLGLSGDLAEAATNLLRISLERAHLKGGSEAMRKARRIVDNNQSMQTGS